MDPLAIVIFLAIGAAAGWLAGRLTGARAFGAIGNIILGVAGALAAGYLLQGTINLGSAIVNQLVSATIGAVVILILARFVRR